MRKLLCGIVACGLLMSCYSDSTDHNYGSFIITVVDEWNRPLPDAMVHGGIDWDEFIVTTDYGGLAVLPDYALGARTTISKNNFYSRIENNIEPGKYSLKRTPSELAKIGNIEGKAIKFGVNQIITTTYQGNYYVYSYDDNGVTELARDSLPMPVKSFRLIGDTLWYTTHDSGMYAYSLANPQHPQKLLHLDIPGYLWSFAKRDTLIAVGDYYGYGPVRIFNYDTEGNANLLGSIGSFIVADMTFMSHYLVTVHQGSGVPNIFDISDPTSMVLVYSGNVSDFGDGFIHGDSVLLKSSFVNTYSGTYQYMMLDLSDPANPIERYTFTAPGTIVDIVQDSLAVGSYYFDSYGQAVFRRGQNGNFEILGIISRPNGVPVHGGSYPPYFIINSNLYKLVPWQN